MRRFHIYTLTLSLAVSLPAQGSRAVPAGELSKAPVGRKLNGKVNPSRPVGPKPITVPLKQITELQSAMPSSLSGFGLVTGLDKTGAGSKVTRQAIVNFIRRHGINVKIEDVSPGATALVAVSATLPAFNKMGMPLDVHVTSLGDEKDLRGGRLLRTKMLGWDGKTYATAEGPVFVNGFKATSQDNKASITANHVTGGTITGGARVVRVVPSSFLSERGHLELRFRDPSVAASIAAADGINKLLKGTKFHAVPVDGYLVRVEIPREMQTEDTAIHLLARIGNVSIPRLVVARVIINETSGLIIAGENVQISPCVLALSTLTITVVSEDEVVQPFPGISNADTAVVSRSAIDVKRDGTSVKGLGGGGASVGDLLSNLKALSLNPQELIEVFTHLKAMGYLHAELITR